MYYVLRSVLHDQAQHFKYTPLGRAQDAVGDGRFDSFVLVQLEASEDLWRVGG